MTEVADFNNKKESGRMTTYCQYFIDHPEKIHTLVGNSNMKRGVLINGEMIALGSARWMEIKDVKIYEDFLLGEIRILE